MEALEDIDNPEYKCNLFWLMLFILGDTLLESLLATIMMNTNGGTIDLSNLNLKGVYRP